MTLRPLATEELKLPKSEVAYGAGRAEADCGICEYYKWHTCEKVRGTINPDQWCKLFQRML